MQRNAAHYENDPGLAQVIDQIHALKLPNRRRYYRWRRRMQSWALLATLLGIMALGYLAPVLGVASVTVWACGIATAVFLLLAFTGSRKTLHPRHYRALLTLAEQEPAVARLLQVLANEDRLLTRQAVRLIQEYGQAVRR